MALVVKNPPTNAGDMKVTGSSPGSGRSPGGEHGNALQYSCLENPIDREAWQAIVCVHHTQLTRVQWGKLPKKNKIREKKSLPCGMFDKNQNFVFGCRHL